MGSRIVAIDNDSATLGFIEDLLDAEGYEVHCSLGYQVNAKDIHAVQPDLVLLELYHNDSQTTLMLLDRLRRFPATRTTPIIVSSTDTYVLDDLSGPLRDLGCTALVKP